MKHNNISGIVGEVADAVSVAGKAPIEQARKDIENIGVARVQRLMGELTTLLAAMSEDKNADAADRVGKDGMASANALSILASESEHSSLADASMAAKQLGDGGYKIGLNIYRIGSIASAMLRTIQPLDKLVQDMTTHQQEGIDTAQEIEGLPAQVDTHAMVYLDSISEE